MLRNRWVITKKYPITGCNGKFNYTIIPVDNLRYLEECEPDAINIDSKQNLAVGTYTDDELNPLDSLCYKYFNTDIATVNHTLIKTFKNSVTRLNVFGNRFGEFSILVDVHDMPFRISRGDNILVQRRYDMADFVWPQEPDDDDEDEYSDPILHDILGHRQEMQRRHEPEELVGPYFRVLYNLTTKRKAKSFPKTTKTKSKSNFGDCDKVVVLGITPTNLEYDIQKHMLLHSDKFGMISCMATEYEPEFLAYTNDRILIQQYYDYNTGEISYRILANKTIDAMRAVMLRNTAHINRR